MSELIDVLRRLTGDPPDARQLDGLDAWWEAHNGARQGFATSIAGAFAGGFVADRLGYAFASGYTEALSALVPSLRGVKAALCATEKGSAHPRSIETTLEVVEDRYRLEGIKSFVTLGDAADELLVVASAGLDDHDRNRLKVVRIPRDRDGVRLEALPPTPFVPEIPHAKLILEGARVNQDEVLDGDGYETYLKPFRTVEDIHVHAALVGWLMKVGRCYGWPRETLEDLSELASALFPLALVDPLDAAVHVTLGGILRRTRSIVESLDWSIIYPETASRFARDAPLLSVASKARDARLETAWARLGRVSLIA